MNTGGWILWIALMGWDGQSQQAALFPHQEACEIAKDRMVKALVKGGRGRTAIVAECLDRDATKINPVEG